MSTDKLLAFVRLVAALETETEINARTDDEGMSGDDAVDTLCGLIQNARDILKPAPVGDFTVSPARYAKGMMAVRCASVDGFKTRTMRLIGHLKARYSNRESAYIMSPTKVERLRVLFDTGLDASAITGQLYEVAA